MKDILKKLFGQTEPHTNETGTAPILPNSLSGSQEITRPLSTKLNLEEANRQADTQIRLELPQLHASCGQSVGQQRSHNEDALYSMTSMLVSNERQFPFGIYIVADGMGGHQHGELASEIATLTMAEHILEHIYSRQIRPNPLPPETSLREILTEGVIKAHSAILGYAPGGGTTLTTLIIYDSHMAIAHVGDSRVYSVDTEGTVRPLTRDHSLVKRLEELGQLTPEEAAIHPQRNVLIRALGQGEPFEPEIITGPLPESGYLLVCSDGLWGLVTDKVLGAIIKTTPLLSEACQKMIDAANNAGGPDNITAVLVRLP